MSAREDILGRVRAALATPRADAAAIAAELAAIPRDFQTTSSLTVEERIELFFDRLRDYDASVHRCASSEVAANVARIMGERGIRSLIAAPDFPAEWLPTC